jgi:hypothetical protein
LLQQFQQRRAVVAAPARRGATTLCPFSAEIGTVARTTMPAACANFCRAAPILRQARAGSATASSLFTANTIEGTRSRLTSSEWRRVCGNSSSAGLAQSSLVASTSTTAASALEAAVTMLRVYCSWPGASPMMNLRPGVAK